jgi:UDPglucose 6-dehydrogenase
VKGADAVFIAVGTPSRRGEGHADLSHAFAAAEEIGGALAKNGNPRTVVVTKSTVPVGTGPWVERILCKALPAQRFDVASNPEFLREGSAIQDFTRPGPGGDRHRQRACPGGAQRALSAALTCWRPGWPSPRSRLPS